MSIVAQNKIKLFCKKKTDYIIKEYPLALHEENVIKACSSHSNDTATYLQS